MSAEIVDLAAKRSASAALIGEIEELLRKARDGEIDSLVYGTTTPDGAIGAGHSIASFKAHLAVASAARLLRMVEKFAFD